MFVFCSYLRLQVRYWADVPAESTLNASAAASPTVSGQATTTVSNKNGEAENRPE